ncbi:MAG: D-alanine--D-alanine ligase [Bacteroidales bacterium]|jgi:D-alanine-D-alanine ligase|nr:D-alanine--D-alanine ligase [Bacteroidales bacterium]
MKKNIAVVTGGNSGEYEISLKSGHNIAQSLDTDLYNVYPIHLRGKDWTYTHSDNAIYPIDKNDFSLLINGQKTVFDCVFIAIHGNPGEDGMLQGYLEMMKIPYTGCNVMASALTFNKNYCNRVLASYNVKTALSVSLFKDDPIDLQAILDVVGLPCFVKPCNSGSSVGMSKVKTRQELLPAIQLAFTHDTQLLIEQFIQGREITCGVMKLHDKIQSLAVTEIVSKNEYFDFEAKYNPALADEITPADIPAEMECLCRQTSEKIYHLLGCKGITRADFIYNESGLYFIEINTIPGQTNESIIPKQVRCLGLNFTDLCTAFIEEAVRKVAQDC